MQYTSNIAKLLSVRLEFLEERALSFSSYCHHSKFRYEEGFSILVDVYKYVRSRHLPRCLQKSLRATRSRYSRAYFYGLEVMV
jgi:hypothetical protein